MKQHVLFNDTTVLHLQIVNNYKYLGNLYSLVSNYNEYNYIQTHPSVLI